MLLYNKKPAIGDRRQKATTKKQGQGFVSLLACQLAGFRGKDKI